MMEFLLGTGFASLTVLWYIVLTKNQKLRDIFAIEDQFEVLDRKYVIGLAIALSFFSSVLLFSMYILYLASSIFQIFGVFLFILGFSLVLLIWYNIWS